MKLTKLHIFLILLAALILCSCLGICSSKEGYMSNDTNKTYHNYDKYYDNKNDANISATDWSQGLDATYNNPYYNKSDDFHRRYKKDSYSYKDDDLNGGDNDNNNDSSSYMISTSYKKKNGKNYGSYNKHKRRENSNNNMFDSVSSGAMNGSTYSYSSGGYGNGNDDGGDDGGSDNGDGITQDQIPDGQEDLYILKSQALTPICPACPSLPKISCDDKCGKAKCQPCPPCARCPEPQFNCVKVPNYNTTGLDQSLPIPWMSKL